MKRLLIRAAPCIEKHQALALSSALLLILVACAAVENNATQMEFITVWDGIYTLEQAERGQKLVDEHCAVRHGRNLHGTQDAPTIAGVEMLFVWDGRSFKELLDYMQMAMPPGQTGVLTDDEFVDVMATILQRSGFPLGEEVELSSSLQGFEKIKIRREKPKEAKFRKTKLVLTRFRVPLPDGSSTFVRFQ